LTFGQDQAEMFAAVPGQHLERNGNHRSLFLLYPREGLQELTRELGGLRQKTDVTAGQLDQFPAEFLA
jgi:hypothetical protein